MNYPKWLLEESDWVDELREAFGGGENQHKMVQMAKDAWNMAYNAGVEGHEALTPGQFCEKYGDKK